MIYLKKNQKWGHEFFSVTTDLKPNGKFWETEIVGRTQVLVSDQLFKLHSEESWGETGWQIQPDQIC